VIAGDGETGKSFLTMAIAATVTTGARWPDGESNGAPGTVIVLNAEDNAEDTIAPRLDACGADSAMYDVIDGTLRKENGEAEFFSLADDLRALESKIIEVGAVLSIVDPLGAYLPGVDTHRDADVRVVLGPLAALAERTGCAILAVCHLNKGASSRVSHRISGSLAFTNAARMCWLVGFDPEDSSQGPDRRRLMLPYKCNIIKKPPGLAFTIDDEGLRWLTDPVTMAAESMLSELSADERTKKEQAEQWLAALLARGPMPVNEIRRAAEADCIAWRTLEDAKKSLSVISDRQGFGRAGHFVWLLNGSAIDRKPEVEESAVIGKLS